MNEFLNRFFKKEIEIHDLTDHLRDVIKCKHLMIFSYSSDEGYTCLSHSGKKDVSKIVFKSNEKLKPMLHTKKKINGILSAPFKLSTSYVTCPVQTEDKYKGVICYDGKLNDNLTINPYMPLIRLLSQQEISRLTKVANMYVIDMIDEIKDPLIKIINSSLESKNTEINNSAMNILNIVNDMYDFSSMINNRYIIDNSVFKPMHPVELAKKITSDKLKSKNQKCVTVLMRETPNYVISDKDKIVQILVNLLDNASQFSSDNGVIQIIVGFSDGMLTYFVCDKGIGMTEKQQQQIFSPFYKCDKKQGGIGLGLSICKKISSILGGAISVVSNPKSGSTFSFDINHTDISYKAIINRLQSYFKDKSIFVIRDESNVGLDDMIESLFSSDTKIRIYSKYNKSVDYSKFSVGIIEQKDDRLPKSIPYVKLCEDKDKLMLKLYNKLGLLHI